MAKIICQKTCQNIILNGSQIIISEQPGEICTFLFPFLSLWLNINEAISREGLVWSNAGLGWQQVEKNKILFACKIWLFTALTSVGVITGVTPLRRSLLYISLCW